jgi:hypothetical protein
MSIFSTAKIKKLIVGALAIIMVSPLTAGNNDRSGSSGSSQLLMLPWARTGSLAGSNLASVSGMEAMAFNVAGLALTEKIDIGYGNVQYMGGSGIAVNTLGMGFRIAESTNIIGVNVFYVNYGDIDITTEEFPAGGVGKYKPNFLTIGLSFAKEFSNSIYGGITVKMISESISNVSAFGFSLDAGIDYITGPKRNFKFGISLRNVGPSMKFKGDGLDIQGTVQNGSSVVTLQELSQGYQLPAQMGLGINYDWYISDNHIIGFDFTFLANSFTKDNFNFGIGYSYKRIVNINFGYMLESGINNDVDRNTVYTGPAMGVNFNIPLGKKLNLGLDYAYRTTNPFSGFHQFGIRLEF